MAPVEIDHVPASVESPAKSFKLVDKAMSLPMVNSAYTEVSKMTYPYVESTMNKVTPVVENTWSKVTPVVETVKSKVEESVLPRIPTKVSETVQNVHNVTVDKVTAAIDKVTELILIFTATLYKLQLGFIFRLIILPVVVLIN